MGTQIKAGRLICKVIHSLEKQGVFQEPGRNRAGVNTGWGKKSHLELEKFLETKNGIPHVASDRTSLQTE